MSLLAEIHEEIALSSTADVILDRNLLIKMASPASSRENGKKQLKNHNGGGA